MKSKTPLPFQTLLNGCFSSLNWIEDIGVFSLFSKAAFLKTGIIMIVHPVFVSLGCFSLEEKHTHNRNYTSTHKSPRYQEQSLGQVWPTTSSSSSSDPTWTLSYLSIFPFPGLSPKTHQECLTPSLLFSLSALLPHQIIQQLHKVPHCLERGAQSQRGRTEGGNLGPPGQELCSSCQQHSSPSTSGKLMF